VGAGKPVAPHQQKQILEALHSNPARLQDFKLALVRSASTSGKRKKKKPNRLSLEDDQLDVTALEDSDVARLVTRSIRSFLLFFLIY